MREGGRDEKDGGREEMEGGRERGIPTEHVHVCIHVHVHVYTHILGLQGVTKSLCSPSSQ